MKTKVKKRKSKFKGAPFNYFLAVQYFWTIYSKRQKQLLQYIGFRWPTKRLNSEMKLVKKENDFGKNVEKQGKFLLRNDDVIKFLFSSIYI